MSREPKSSPGSLARSRARHQRQAAMSSALAALRRGDSVTVYGKTVLPWPSGKSDVFSILNGYVVEALFLYRGKIRLRYVSFKDAWPNPRLWGGRVDGTRHIPHRNLYGYIPVKKQEKPSE